MAKVYAKLKECKGMQLITDINSEYYISDLTGWTLIDEGRGSKYTHAQAEYLGDTLVTEDGYYKYKFISGTGIVKLTDEEMTLQKGGTQPDTPVNPPDKPGTDTNYDFPQYYIADGLEQRIIIEEIKEDKLVTGFNFSFIAIFDNEGKATTINDYPFYKEGTTEPPVVKEQCAYTVWFDEDKKCFFVEASATGNAVPADVLEGVTFSSDTGADLKGTMKNNGAVKKVLDYDEEFEIAEGYHNGQGKVVAPSAGEDSTETTATSADLLEGKTARSKGEEITGGMTDNGAIKKVLGYDEEFVIPKGYHNGEGKVLAPTKGDDTSDATLSNEMQLQEGITAYSKGKKFIGKLKVVAPVNNRLNCGQKYTIPEGIHDGKGVIEVSSLASQTAGTATAGDIAKGLTAVVNGKLLVGTADKAPAMGKVAISSYSSIKYSYYSSDGTKREDKGVLSGILKINNLGFVPSLVIVFPHRYYEYVGRDGCVASRISVYNEDLGSFNCLSAGGNNAGAWGTIDSNSIRNFPVTANDFTMPVLSTEKGEEYTYIAFR